MLLIVSQINSLCFFYLHIPGVAITAVRDQVMRHNPQTGVSCGRSMNTPDEAIVFNSEFWDFNL